MLISLTYKRTPARCYFQVSPLSYSLKTKSKGTESNQPVHTSEVPSMSLGFADYLSVAQGLLPVAWDVARPLLTAWGIQKVQAWIIKKLFKKKK